MKKLAIQHTSDDFKDRENLRNKIYNEVQAGMEELKKTLIPGHKIPGTATSPIYNTNGMFREGPNGKAAPIQDMNLAQLKNVLNNVQHGREILKSTEKKMFPTLRGGS